MYNFWFTANVPPRAGSGTLELFKTGTPGSISPTIRVPGCPSDVNLDGSVDGDDVIAFFAAWDSGSLNGGDYNGDGGVDGDDVIGFFAAWDSGC
jgi:hypothetical protein